MPEIDKGEGGCIFCKIVTGEAPTNKILETNRVLLITAINGGYPLLLTKEHFKNLIDPRLDEETAAEIGRLRPRIGRMTVLSEGVDSLTNVTNSGLNAGQDIEHYHEHFIPRSAGDGMVRFSYHQRITDEELNRKARLYRQTLMSLGD